MRILFRIIILVLRVFTREDPSGEPRYILYLLYPFLAERERETFIGDLIQDYKTICSASNKMAADKWLHNEVFISLRSLIKRPTILINFLWKWNIELVRSPRFAFAIILISFISLAFWLTQLKSNQPSLIQNRPAPDRPYIESPPDSARELKIPNEVRTDGLARTQPQPVKSRQVKNLNPQPSAPLASTVVLMSPTVLRDMEQDGGKDSFIKVSNTRVRMKLLLAAGSTKGTYSVSILDAFGNPLRVNKVQGNGKFVITTFDMRQLPPKKYFISVSHEGEAPNFYPIVVIKK